MEKLILKKIVVHGFIALKNIVILRGLGNINLNANSSGLQNTIVIKGVIIVSVIVAVRFYCTYIK